ncbi:MAG TPA: phenylacetate-CoA oxygenase subunit PaaI [Flavobacteriales bacterium]|jgi:ring-1,2-phenylacetyl-CoA epoxidase subunit PaaC|nr:phenylacetate-CoA oxygenase subunit PaaC [Flavobacteriales bacterium]HAW19660.1 phenylacetate-CoA oxygenase subunit PaaI [Flavobacteriales bacterium]
MSENNNLMNVALHLGDNALILGHRISEWCGHGPVLEQDIAMTNIALDLIGQAKMYLDLAAELEGKGNDHDHLAYKRDVLDFKNLLITEIPNGDFADSIARQFFFDQWHFLLLSELSNSSNDRLKEIAQKALKEVTYHKRWSSEWVVRLGDGTAESKEKMQRAIDDIWFYTGEAFMPAKYEEGILPTGLKDTWMKNVKVILEEATLMMPADEWMQDGGKTGKHTEYLGFILAEMQFLPRAYPDATW